MIILVKKIESYKIKFNPKYRDFFAYRAYTTFQSHNLWYGKNEKHQSRRHRRAKNRAVFNLNISRSRVDIRNNRALCVRAEQRHSARKHRNQNSIRVHRRSDKFQKRTKRTSQRRDFGAVVHAVHVSYLLRSYGLQRREIQLDRPCHFADCRGYFGNTGGKRQSPQKLSLRIIAPFCGAIFFPYNWYLSSILMQHYPFPSGFPLLPK